MVFILIDNWLVRWWHSLHPTHHQ